MLGAVLVNFNTSELTLECLRSVAASELASVVHVVVVDNDSDDAQREVLETSLREISVAALDLIHMSHNAGFAAACNHAIEALLKHRGIERILLLNNDAVLVDGGLSALLAFADDNPQADMIAARMQRLAHPEQVDSMGIAMYASALASNRVHADDTLLGPTGGLALYSRHLIETLTERHGSVFDERFFCYAEDTDLALRARLLGFNAAYLDQCVALHWGQASSGGGFSDFVLYHGIRNSIWTLIKNFPMIWLIALSPLIVSLHMAIVVRHSLAGRRKVVWRLYRDAFRGIPAMWRSRRIIQVSRVLSLSDFGRLLTPRFYDRQYLRTAWRELWKGREPDDSMRAP